jgi:hypothetical protein
MSNDGGDTPMNRVEIEAAIIALSICVIIINCFVQIGTVPARSAIDSLFFYPDPVYIACVLAVGFGRFAGPIWPVAKK